MSMSSSVSIIAVLVRGILFDCQRFVSHSITALFLLLAHISAGLKNGFAWPTGHLDPAVPKGVLTTAFVFLNNSSRFERLLKFLKPKKSDEQLQAEADARTAVEREQAEKDRRKRYGL
jgi:hypothetical protein